MSRLVRWWKAVVARRRFEDEMREEMEAHLALRREALIERGLSPQEAERRANLEFGSVESFKEGCREARGLQWGDELVRNVRFAVRGLMKAPVLALTVVVTLGLSIGANVTVFSMVDAVLLRALPYPDPDELQLVGLRFESGETAQGHTGRTWEILRDNATDFDLVAFSGWPSGANLVAGDLVEYVQQQRVGSGFFRLLGVAPFLGRGFSREEDVPDGPPVVVLSHALWQRAFGAADSVLGSSILIAGRPHTVVGVMPQGFRTSVEAQLWTPLRPSTEGEGQGANYRILARPKSGVAVATAREELRTLDRIVKEEASDWRADEAGLSFVSLKDGLTESSRERLLLALATVALVLLVGCLNVAGLLLARAIGRSDEISARLALGGGRWTIVRQLLTESLVLASVGGLLGVALAGLGLALVRESASEILQIWQPVALDVRAILFTAGLTSLAAFASGLLPAMRASSLGKELSRVAGSARSVVGRHSWQRRILVGAQVALAMVLLVGAGLLLRTLRHLYSLEPGFDPSGVVTAAVSLDDARYRSREEVERLFTETLERLREQPSVEHAAAGLSLPFQRPLNVSFLHSGEDPSSASAKLTNLTYITLDYFDALGISLLQGRSFDLGDRFGAPQVVVVNQAFAETYFETGGALGARIALSGSEREIVGVIRDVQQTPSWGDFGPLGSPPAVFMPLDQSPDELVRLAHTWFQPSWIVRVRGRSAQAVAELGRVVESVDPLLPLARFRTMDQLRGTALGTERFLTGLLVVTASLALALSAVGIAALIASSVLERRRELGVRLALGATVPRTIAAAALPGLALTGIGVVVGSFVALGAGRVLAHAPYGVEGGDAPTFLLACLVQLSVAGIASLVPALRVARLDPVETLKGD